MYIFTRIELTYFLKIIPISGCKPGYFSFNCNQTCKLPFYGIGCQSECDCPDDKCDFAKGCPGK